MNKKIMPFLNIKNINYNILKIIIIFIFFILLNFSISSIYKKTKNIIRKKRIGVISVWNEPNVGNMLVKFSMYTKLKEYGLDPVIICNTRGKTNIDFLKRYVKFKEIKKNFSELNKNDYDILMVNSDQTWSRCCGKQHFYDYAFLRFAKDWPIPKFIYAASFAREYWPYSNEVNKIAKTLLKNFKGISLREKGSINLVENNLGIKPFFVLDPTFLIDKKYYLNLIKYFNLNFNFNEKYIFVYQLDNNKIIENFIQKASKKLNYKIYKVSLSKINYVENFIFGINASQAVITDSFHGTVFSIIFNKPFISYINSKRGRARFYSLNETFNLNKRIIFPNKNEEQNIKLLSKPLNINKSLFNNLKKFSIIF